MKEKEEFYAVHITVDGYDGNFVFGTENQTEFVTEDYDKAEECYKYQLKVLRDMMCIDNSLGAVHVTLERRFSAPGVIYFDDIKSKRLGLSKALYLFLQQDM